MGCGAASSRVSTSPPCAFRASFLASEAPCTLEAGLEFRCEGASEWSRLVSLPTDEAACSGMTPSPGF